MDRLPYIYAALWLGEVAWLLNRYLRDAPTASDPLSVGLGWVGIGSMVALLVYSVARRSRVLRRWAALSYWLHFHIFLACQGCLAVLFHCWHLFGKEGPIHLLNPGFISGVGTLVIFASGLFGRYLYSLLPRTLGGVQMEAQEVDDELRQGTVDLGPAVQALLGDAGREPTGFVGLVVANLAARRALSQLPTLGLSAEHLGLAQRRLRLKHRRLALVAAERVFRRWIVLHRPMAAALYVVAAVHIMFSYMFSSALAG